MILGDMNALGIVFWTLYKRDLPFMVYQTKIVDWHEYAEPLSALRYQVFVIEQGVPVELEIDGEDLSACHVAALIDSNQVIGTGRILVSGKIGRMAVRSDMRQQGVGRAVLDALRSSVIRSLRSIAAHSISQWRGCATAIEIRPSLVGKRSNG